MTTSTHTFIHTDFVWAGAVTVGAATGVGAMAFSFSGTTDSIGCESGTGVGLASSSFSVKSAWWPSQFGNILRQ